MSQSVAGQCFTAAVTELNFDRMRNSPAIEVEDYQLLGSMSDYYVRVSFTLVADVGGGSDE